MGQSNTLLRPFFDEFFCRRLPAKCIVLNGPVHSFPAFCTLSFLAVR